MSLNDQLETGPDYLQSLLGVLIRFRQFPIAIKADIRDMFLRVKVRDIDRGTQRFLWRGAVNAKEPDEYEMTCLIFGAKSFPCSAMYVKNQNALRYQQSHPTAVRSIVEDSYMDDFLSSTKTVREAKSLVRQVNQINSEANFSMHGWASNNPRVFDGFDPIIDLERDRNATFCDHESERVMGLYWDRISDELGFGKDTIRNLTCPKKTHKARISAGDDVCF